MKRLTKLGSLLLMSLLVFSSCCRSGNADIEDPYAKKRGDLVIRSSIQGMTTRTIGDNWEAGDAIGVFAVNGGQALSEGSIQNDQKNRKYTTNGSSAFASLEGVTIPDVGAIDIYAYYPYNAAQSGLDVAFNTSNQSDLGGIDLLYSNNVKGISKENNMANLTFKHMLSMVVFEITSEQAITGSSSVRLADVLVDGRMSLVDGKITVGNAIASPAVNVQEVTPGSKYQVKMILPPQSLEGKKVTFMFNGKSYEHALTGVTMESGFMYPIAITFKKEGTISITNATILPWETGVTPDEPIIINPEEGTDVEPTPIVKEISIDVTEHAIVAEGGSVTVPVVADNAVSWNAVRGDTWLAVTPESGNGNGTLTITATENNTGATRIGKVIVSATSVASTGLRATGETVTITITQEAKTDTPTPEFGLLFNGSDFEDWAAFTGNLNEFGLQKYAAQSPNGRNGSALYINGTPGGNDYVFTALAPANAVTKGSTIELYIKGKADKSMSFNVYLSNNTYAVFNIDEIGGDGHTVTPADAPIVLKPAPLNNQGNGTNSYAKGKIDTQGQWLKITMDISSLDLASSNSYFAVKVGSKVAWDMLIDDITIK